MEGYSVFSRVSTITEFFLLFVGLYAGTAFIATVLKFASPID